MSNVVMLRPPVACGPSGPEGLIPAIADARRGREDVFWLKENAELLNCFQSLGLPLDPRVLEPLSDFYTMIEARLGFFPQYYRFLLGICLDLEDLGLGDTDCGARLCAQVKCAGLAQAELSDLQRAEARRLLARRGVSFEDPDLDQRLRAFIARSGTFALPNKKAAYELTHIVFYLSEYGRRDPDLCAEALTSLHHAGLLAYLDQNADLLAEVCLALRFAKARPNRIWEDMVRSAHRAASVVDAPQERLTDGFHTYLVTGWLAAAAGAGGFDHAIPRDDPRFRIAAGRESALRSMSECLFSMGENRNSDWISMRGHVLARMGPDAHEVLVRAERSTPHFDAFFAEFARA